MGTSAGGGRGNENEVGLVAARVERSWSFFPEEGAALPLCDILGASPILVLLMKRWVEHWWDCCCKASYITYVPMCISMHIIIKPRPSMQ